MNTFAREHMLYIFDSEGNTMQCDWCMECWGRWWHDNRCVAYETISSDPKVIVSTVFLGIDHDFSLTGIPVLWETMILGGEHDGYQERYTTRKDAMEGHERAVMFAKGVKVDYEQKEENTHDAGK